MKKFRIILPALFVGLLIVFPNNSLAQKIEKDKKTITITSGKKNKDITWVFSTEEKSSRLILKKSFDSESLTKKSNFKVEEDQNKIKLSISGSCSSGKIAISVLLPSKEVFKNIEIDPSADVEWSQTIRFLEEKDKYIGNWIIVIDVEKAVGRYYLMISAD